MYYGIKPDLLIGHSLGELTAATISGVFEIEEALEIVWERGCFIQKVKTGKMLSIDIDFGILQSIINKKKLKVEISLHNSPKSSVVSGTSQDIDNFKVLLKERNITFKELKTKNAYHCHLMKPAAEKYVEFLRKKFGEKRKKSQIPFISNVTGKSISLEKIITPEYWGEHIYKKVKFSESISKILEDKKHITFIEVGPSNILKKLVNHHNLTNNQNVISTVRHPKFIESDVKVFYKALGELWKLGIKIDWKNFNSGDDDDDVFRVSLPGYPFKHRKCWGVNLNPLYVSIKKEEMIMKKLMSELSKKYKTKSKKNKIIKRVFLTGASGFLGKYILKYLKKNFETIYCLCRVNSKMLQILKKDEKKIKIILGDLSKPYFGLKKEDFEKIRNEIDAIIHCGFDKSGFKNYKKLYDTNVKSLFDIIKLACGYKPIYFISSIVVYGTSYPGALKNISTPRVRHSPNRGYAASKWVCDILLQKFYKNFVIFRPTMIIGSFETGEIVKDDFLGFLINVIEKVGYAPTGNKEIFEAKLNVINVDYVAQSIVKTLLIYKNNNNNNVRSIFDISYQNKSIEEIINMIGEIYKIKRCSLEKWKQKVDKLRVGDNLLFSLFYNFLTKRDNLILGRSMNDENFYKLIKSTPKPIDIEILRKYSNYPYILETYSIKNNYNNEEIEDLMEKVFCKVIGIDNFEKNWNFFEMGGDSATMMTCISILKDNGIILNMDDFIKNSTIESLSKIVKDQEYLDFDIPKEPCRLLPQQLDCLKLKDPDHNNINMFVRSENINLKILKAAFFKLIETHPSLKLRFYKKDKIWYQIYNKKNDNNKIFITIDYSKVSDLILHQKIIKKTSDHQTTLSLKDGRLLKIIVFKLKEGVYSILFICHKIIFDFTSLEILLKDLRRIYFALDNNKPFTNEFTKKKTHPLGRYAELIAKSESSESSDLYIKEEKFWKSQIPPLTKKKYNLTMDVKFSDQDHIIIDTKIKNDIDIEKFTKRVRINEKEFFLTAFIKTIKEFQTKYSDKENVYVDIVNYDRKVHQRKVLLNSTIGNITQTFPLYWNKLPKNLEEIMLSVKLKIRNVPNFGIGFRFLKKNQLLKEFKNHPLFCFNYIGKLETPQKTQFDFQYFIQSMSNKNKRHYLVNIFAGYTDSNLIIYIDYTKEKKILKGFKKLLEKNIKELIKFCSKDVQEINFDENENSRILKLLVNVFNNPKAVEDTLILRKQGKPIIWFFHPMIGYSGCYMNLARELNKIKSPVSVYGLNYPYLLDLNYTFESLEKMVEYYVKVIKKTQPNGPYYLGGFSMGGLLAIEACKQIKNVGKIFIFDPTGNKKIVYPEKMMIKKKKLKKEREEYLIKIARLEEFDELKPLVKYYKSSEKNLYELNHIFKIVDNMIKITTGYLFNGIIDAEKIIFLRVSEGLKNNLGYNNIDTFIEKFTDNWVSCFKTTPSCYTVIGEHNDIINDENSKKIAEIINYEIYEIYEIYQSDKGVKDCFNRELFMKKLKENAIRVNDTFLLNLIKNVK
jgi:thioester reductase-like protein